MTYAKMNNRLTRWIAPLALWFAGCAAVTPDYRAAESYVPGKFHAYIGGMMGPSSTVDFIPPRTLRYIHTDHGRKVESVLIDFDPSHWEGVYMRLEAVGVFDWRTRYTRKDVHDGTQWTLDCTFPPRRKTASGDNAYPEYGEFKVFLELMSDMAGGRKFE